jgi:TPR repeat protein
MKSCLLLLVVTAWLALPLAPCFADSLSLAEIRTKAEQGNAEAQYNLGKMYYDGDGVPQDSAEAVKWYRKAAEQGYAEAQSNLSDIYEEGSDVPRDSAEAVKWCRKAAEQGYAKAQFDLGNYYSGGEGGVRRDSAEAVKWYRKAAEQDYADAQYTLSQMYEEGKDVPRDYIEAYMWILLTGVAITHPQKVRPHIYG